MKRYILVLLALLCSRLALVSQSDTLFLPFDAEALTNEQKRLNPDYLSYPLNLVDKVPEILCSVPWTCDSAVDLGLSVKWAEHNVGATAPEGYGDYFAWGEVRTKALYNLSTYEYCKGSGTTFTKYCTDGDFGYNGFVDNKTQLELSDDVAVLQWAGDWRMPTYEEMVELRDRCTWDWTTFNGVKGYRVIGPNGNSIFLPAAGVVTSGNRPSNTDRAAYYWTSSLYSSPELANFLNFFSNIINLGSGGNRAWGCSVRAVCANSDSLQQVDDVDSIVGLDLELEPQVVIYDTICWVQKYEFKDYEFRLPSYVGFENEDYIDYVLEYRDKEACVSYVMNLAIIPMENGMEIVTWDTIQRGGVYDWYGEKLVEKGEYRRIVHEECECSIEYVLHLEVLDIPMVRCNGELCREDTFVFKNKKYIEPGVYYDTLRTAVWVDTIYELTLVDMRKYVEISVSNVLSYTFNGEIYTESGVYVDTLQTLHGCDSVVTLNLRVLPQTVFAILNDTICIGDGYIWNGVEYYKGGSYTDTLRSALGGDSVVTLNLEVLPTYYFTESATIKVGKTYNWHGKHLREAGVYYDSLLTAAGCDSVWALTLSVDENYAPMVIDCEMAVDLGLSVKWAPFNLGATMPEESGDYFAWGETKPKGRYSWDTYKFGDIANITKYNKTDGLTTLQPEDDAATVNWGGYWRMPTMEEVSELFDNCTWSWTTQNGVNGYVVTGRNGQSIFLPIVGFVSDDGIIGEGENVGYWMNEQASTVEGVSMILFKNGKDKNSPFFKYRGYTIRPICAEPVLVADTVMLCYGETYTWRGVEYAESGIYSDTIHGASRDTVKMLDLTILPEAVGSEENTIICYGETYTWRGVEYSETGVYRDTLQSVHGCDSVVTLNLKVSHTYSSGENATIQLGESYQWRGESYSVAGVYIDELLTVDGCDSIFTLTLTVKGVVVDAINIAEQCAGTGVMDVEVLLASSKVDEVSFEFSHDAKNAGLANVTLPYSEQMQVQYTSVRAGRYAVTVMGLRNGVKVFEEEKDLTFLYPSSVLKQHWNDVVAVLTHDYNGGYNFVDFQWYKDGVMLEGETRSYISMPLTFGSEYSALLTEDNGLQMMTCVLIATEHVDVFDPLEEVDISLYPTVLNGSQKVKCIVSETAVVYVYNMLGKLMLRYNIEAGETELDMPYVAGAYMVKVVATSNKERNIKLIVR